MDKQEILDDVRHWWHFEESIETDIDEDIDVYLALLNNPNNAIYHSDHPSHQKELLAHMLELSRLQDLRRIQKSESAAQGDALRRRRNGITEEEPETPDPLLN